MDVVVEDEYIQEMQQEFDEEYERLSQVVKEYISILKEITASGITHGKTANALKEFTSLAEELRQVGRHRSAAKRYCQNFLDKIDDADGDLY
ncbi:MAG: hypothetical protein PHN80_01280 [Hespellia sp.]|nr:hypothetical protein [Hespellia sp.]